jgi:hypothetical protein
VTKGFRGSDSEGQYRGGTSPLQRLSQYKPPENAAVLRRRIDRNGTDRDAIRAIFGLQKAHPSQFSAKYFHAPSKSSIFHPKLYIYEWAGRLDYVLGSANLTFSGISANFESIQVFEELKASSSQALLAKSIWNTFADPKAPLTPNFLKPLTKDEVRKLLRNLPRRSREDKGVTSSSSALWQPLSRIRLPRSGEKLGANRQFKSFAKQPYLVMDILTETRKTQMQIPLPVVRDFFRIEPDKPATISVRLFTDTGLSQPISRPIVISGLGYDRLMRRLEMPQIRSLPRPLSVIFVKLPGKHKFAYFLVDRNNRAFKSIDQLLTRDGQQGGRERRYFIGQKGDANYGIVSKLLQ